MHENITELTLFNMIIFQVVFVLLVVFCLLVALSAVRINKGLDNDYPCYPDYPVHKMEPAEKVMPSPVAQESPRKMTAEDLAQIKNMNRIMKLIKQKQNELAQLEVELAEARENLTNPLFISRSTLIRSINHLATRQQPFLFAIDFDAQNGFVLSPDEAASQGIFFKIGDHQNYPERAGKHPTTFTFTPVDLKTYEQAFNKVQHHLKTGNTYLLNLTFQTPLQTDLSLEELFYTGQAPFKLFVPNQFVVFSPEPFVSTRDGMITSCPMKGTISADVPDAEKRLLGDDKEFFEHNTIVDLIRNDLSMVSTGVKVDRFRYIDRIHTNRGDLLQMSSEISGKLPADYRSRLGDILFALLPAGSVTGAPKEKTVQTIREAENYDRGFYTGIFGYFDGKSLVSAVAIRFIEMTPDGLVFKSGGGITALSDMHDEYDEMLKKIYVPVV
jgi:para-aminobenzoate synthetase component 1